MNPYVFLVGCPRSGTTLLRRIADAHPQLAVVHETRWIPRTFEFRRGLTPEGLVTPKLLARMRDARRLRRLEIDEGEFERSFGNVAGVPFASFVTALFDLYGERHGKRLVGDKSPGYVRYMPMLHGLWPHARFVHIIRDGRDVCLSVLDWRKGATSYATFHQDPVTTIGVWWEWYVRLGLEGSSQLEADLYHELRYESLVAEPELETRRLCDVLGLPYDPEMLRFHKGRTVDDPRLDAKRAWKPVTAGLRSWRTQMSDEDVVRFESAAGVLLDELGYEPGAPSIPSRDLERAARIRERFIEQARERRRPVPKAWLAATDARVGSHSTRHHALQIDG
jgi:Sulfotransferase family